MIYIYTLSDTVTTCKEGLVDTALRVNKIENRHPGIVSASGVTAVQSEPSTGHDGTAVTYVDVVRGSHGHSTSRRTGGEITETSSDCQPQAMDLGHPGSPSSTGQYHCSSQEGRCG